MNLRGHGGRHASWIMEGYINNRKRIKNTMDMFLPLGCCHSHCTPPPRTGSTYHLSVNGYQCLVLLLLCLSLHWFVLSRHYHQQQQPKEIHESATSSPSPLFCWLANRFDSIRFFFVKNESRCASDTKTQISCKRLLAAAAVVRR